MYIPIFVTVDKTNNPTFKYIYTLCHWLDAFAGNREDIWHYLDPQIFPHCIIIHFIQHCVYHSLM